MSGSDRCGRGLQTGGEWPSPGRPARLWEGDGAKGSSGRERGEGVGLVVGDDEPGLGVGPVVSGGEGSGGSEWEPGRRERREEGQLALASSSRRAAAAAASCSALRERERTVSGQ